MRRTVSASLFICLALLALSASALPISGGVHFFGNSLTDTGNVTEVYAAIPIKPPGAPPVVPGPPYDPQGRASNGPLYADVLAEGLGFNALAATRGGNNFAFGGARTRYQLFGPPFLSIIDQVAAFRAQPGPADPNALYVLWAGSNNLQDIFLGRTTDVLGNPIPGPLETILDVRSMILGLYAEGARNLLVPNVPNLGLVPRLRDLGGPAAQAAARAAVQAYNAAFEGMLAVVDATLGDINLVRFDTFAALNDLAANAIQFGITNTTDRCYTGDDLTFTGGGSVCANPDEFFFWDGIHPTTIVHQLLGRQMLAAVQSANEPSPLALLIFAPLLGWIARSSRSRRA